MISRKLPVVIMLLATGVFVVPIFAQDEMPAGVDMQSPDAARPEAADSVPSAADDTAVPGESDDDSEQDDVPTHVKQLAAAGALRPSMVVVEYTLRYDKGEQPVFYGNIGGRYAARFIEQERPLEMSGLLLTPTTVLTPDLIIHPRFVEAITVRAGDKTAVAHPKGYFVDQPAMLLELDEALPGTSPLEFDPSGEEPYLGASYQINDGQWTINVSGTMSVVALTETGRTFSPSSENIILLTEDSKPVGVSMSDEMPADDSWKGSPLDWPMIPADEMAEKLQKVEATANGALVRVALNFRSPRKRPGVRMSYDASSDSGEERNVVGVLIGDTRVLVLADMRQHVTRRLERINVYPAGGGDPVPAKFVASLKDFGGLIAELDSSLPGAVALADENILDYRGKLLMLADVKLQGDNRVAYFAHSRIAGYQLGWERIVYPVLSDSTGVFLFDGDDRLIVMPISRRLKTTVAGSYSAPELATAAAELAFVAGDDLVKATDPNNTPLTEAEENRLAWLGVELQPLTQDLARMYKVSDITNDGQTGAIVSYVYPGSPAEEAGVQPRWILLRLNIPGQPKPLEVQTSEWVFETQEFPWEQYDELPEMYYDEIPTPWAPTENRFTRALTDLGFGTAFEAEFFADGQIVKKNFTVVESPPHYDTAPRYENDALGMTVQDMTYEVRRYFLKDPEEEGIVISKVQPGSLASVAGVKPHEIITTVNDKPVYSAKDFEDLIADQTNLRLHVMRMTSGRNVKMSLPSFSPEEPVDTLTEPTVTEPILPVEPEALPELPEVE